MNSPGKRWVMIPAAVAAGVILLGLLVKEKRPPVPDEKAAGVALLADKQRGPGYFHEEDSTSPGPFDEGGPWLSSGQAQIQIERVVRERHFNPEQAKQVKDLLDTLAEPHPSRTVGGERLPLVKLNLALDSVR